jgi:hypothetical protein
MDNTQEAALSELQASLLAMEYEMRSHEVQWRDAQRSGFILLGLAAKAYGR